MGRSCAAAVAIAVEMQLRLVEKYPTAGLVPDLAGWRRERMPVLPEAAAFELAPDWICEVLSPSTAATDRAEKMPIYAREEVASLWLVDPMARTLEVFQLDQSRWVLLGTWRDDAKVRAEPFAEFELNLSGLWAK